MELLQPSPRTAPASMTLMARRQKINWLLFALSALLCALSITVFGLISSVVAWIHDQKHQVHVYHVNWPGNPTQINVEPKSVWTDQGHESNGAAVYGFFLGVFGMVTAWRMRKTGQGRKSLSALAILSLLGSVFCLSAFIFVFVVTYQTTGQHIKEPIASNTVGINYPYLRWTPETWFKAVLDLPLADGTQAAEIKTRLGCMVAWRWILLPLLLVNITTFCVAVMTWSRRRRDDVLVRTNSGHSVVEKSGSR